MIDAKSAVYEIANFIQGIEQLTVTTLRNVIGSLDLEQTLTSRDQINGQLRGVLDEATGKWGIRVNRVELKAIDPPHSVQDSMEKQMRAERDRRAAILTAEGVKQSADPHRRGREAEPDPARRGLGAGPHPRGPGPGPRHPAGVRRDPPRQADPEAARLPVPPGAAADRPRRLQQDVDHPERAHRRPQGHRQRARRQPGRSDDGGDDEDAWVDTGEALPTRLRRHRARGPGPGAGRGPRARPARPAPRPRSHRPASPARASQPPVVAGDGRRGRRAPHGGRSPTRRPPPGRARRRRPPTGLPAGTARVQRRPRAAGARPHGQPRASDTRSPS